MEAIVLVLLAALGYGIFRWLEDRALPEQVDLGVLVRRHAVSQYANTRVPTGTVRVIHRSKRPAMTPTATRTSPQASRVSATG